MPFVRTEDRGGIAVVALDRPPANAMVPELLEELAATPRASPPSVRGPSC